MKSPDTGTNVSIAAQFEYKDGQSFTIQSQDIQKLSTGGCVNFSLASPMVVGTLEDFAEWLAGEFGVANAHTEIHDALANMPSWLADLVNDFLSPTLTITVLDVTICKEKGKGKPSLAGFSFGVTWTYSPPKHIVGPLYFDGIGALIERNAGASS